MISEKEAVQIFKKSYPKLKITNGCIYTDKKSKNKYYILTAPDGKVDYNDPFYAINVKTGEISSFSPAADLDRYFEALDNNPMTIITEVKRSITYSGRSIFDPECIIRNNMYPIKRSGVQGMHWYHRYHQSYKTKPTRSGKVGEEHFDTHSREENKELSNKILNDILNGKKIDANNYKIDNNKYAVKSSDRNFKPDKDDYIKYNKYKKKYNKDSRRLNKQITNDVLDGKKFDPNNYNPDNKRYDNDPNKLTVKDKKSLVKRLLDSARKSSEKRKYKAIQKEYRKNKKMQLKADKMRLKAERKRIKAEINNTKKYLKTKNPVEYQDNKSKRESLMSDDPKTIMKKWKGKLDNRDLQYLEQRIKYEDMINDKISKRDRASWDKLMNTTKKLGIYTVKANNIFSDVWNTVNQKDIDSGNMFAWPFIHLNDYNYNNNHGKKGKKNKKNRNRR